MAGVQHTERQTGNVEESCLAFSACMHLAPPPAVFIARTSEPGGVCRTGDLQPTRGEVKRHSHLSIGRYHQHSVDVLDESMRVLDFFMHTCALLALPYP